MAKDLICGMDVDEKGAEFMVHLEHETLYFCSKACQEEFERKEGLRHDEPGKKWWQKILKEPKGSPLRKAIEYRQPLLRLIEYGGADHARRRARIRLWLLVAGGGKRCSLPLFSLQFPDAGKKERMAVEEGSRGIHSGALHRNVRLLNSWQDMPPVDEQAALPGSRANSEFFAARLLLRPGRKYETAVKRFSPYEHIQDPYPEGRQAVANLIKRTMASGNKTQAFIYLNNRFEGNALESITAILDQVEV